MGHGLPATRGDAGNPLACAPDCYGARMATKSKAKWGRTLSVVGPIPGGLCPPLEMLCRAGAASTPEWGWRRGYLPRTRAEGRVFPRGSAAAPRVQLPAGWRALWLAEHCRSRTGGYAGGC